MSAGGDSRRLQTARALVITGLILYVPANILPVMTMTVVGDVEPLTVLGGVQELYDSGLWPIAGIVADSPHGLIAKRLQGVRVWDGWLDFSQLSFVPPSP